METATVEREIEIAKNAILEGANDDFIAKITGLTLVQVGQLRRVIKK
jgi:hypothetical protein